MGEVKVIDISCYNPADKSKKIDYAAVKKDGIEYVVAKAISKSGAPDRRFEEHLAGCAAAGITVFATYHYSYATSVQMARDMAKKWMKAVNGRVKLFCLDWEDSDTLPKDKRAVDIINAYAEEITKAGYQFAVYTGQYWYNAYLSKYANLLPYDFWIARYYAGYKTFTSKSDVNKSYVPSINRPLMGWQYTSSGNIHGIAGPVDVNIWYKDIEAPKPETKLPNETLFETNPYNVPTKTVKLGTTGNDANWVLWYLWRFGLLLDSTGKIPDSSRINGVIDAEDVEAIRRSQQILGTTADGMVGKITRGLYMKIC